MTAMPTDFAASERAQLADLLERVGPDAPTLCEGWTTADLAAHLDIRENDHLATLGAFIPAFADRTRQAMAEQLRSLGYLGVVGRIRTGPSGPTIFRIPAVERAANLVEYFVHHEDVRRAEPGWEPRSLAPAYEDLLWNRLRGMSRLMLRKVASGVLLTRSDRAGDPRGTVRARRGEPVAVVEGLPSELTLYAFGRRSAARVDLRGDPVAIEALTHAPLGF